MNVAGTAGFALAALLFGALAGWQLLARGGAGRWGAVQWLLVLGLAATALWGLAGAAEGPLAPVTRIAGSGRNFAWLGFMLTLLLAARGERAVQASLVLVHATLAAVLAGQTAFDLLPDLLPLGPRAAALCGFVALLLRMVIAVGALVLVHNLYTAAAHDARSAIRLPMAALAVIWGFDLNCYATTWALGGYPQALFAARGAVAAATAPLFAIALWRHAGFAMRLSRAATFRSLSLLAILSYLALLLVVERMTRLLGGDGGWLAVSTLGAGGIAGAALLVPPRLRAWTRVMVAKHLFQHRYDYRAEWLRFTDTLGRAEGGGVQPEIPEVPDRAVPLDGRVVKALADIVEAPGGMLLLPDDDGAGGGLVPAACWNWAPAVPPRAATPALAAYLATHTRILELDAARAGRVPDAAALLPEWLLAERQAWIAVPLVHFGRLAGVALLTRPPVARPLDWEDYDLLRAAGRQAASYLAESRGQAALAQAARFDEFNRRFAFVIHDIKNLVSQLSLVSRNAARHADNPAFRADMIATLQDSVGRMNDLLARLGSRSGPRGEAPRPIDLVPLVAGIARAARPHPVLLLDAEPVAVVADPARLEQAIGHLLHNAIDASGPDMPVMLRVGRSGPDAAIEVIDTGTGMSPDFVRTRLFAPFASTKPGGFGIGAFEARAIVTTLGGRIEVESATGIGTRFRILLPRAASATLPRAVPRIESAA